jgi:hypothetical protein
MVPLSRRLLGKFRCQLRKQAPRWQRRAPASCRFIHFRSRTHCEPPPARGALRLPSRNDRIGSARMAPPRLNASGRRDGIRTHNLQIRSLAIYPVDRTRRNGDMRGQPHFVILGHTRRNRARLFAVTGPLRVCAVKRRRFPVGASPTRRPLQPEATGAGMEATKCLKPSDSGSRNTVTARVCRPQRE